jgi:hypothetical protein
MMFVVAAGKTTNHNNTSRQKNKGLPEGKPLISISSKC